MWICPKCGEFGTPRSHVCKSDELDSGWDDFYVPPEDLSDRELGKLVIAEAMRNPV